MGQDYSFILREGCFKRAVSKPHPKQNPGPTGAVHNANSVGLCDLYPLVLVDDVICRASVNGNTIPLVSVSVSTFCLS